MKLNNRMLIIKRYYKAKILGPALLNLIIFKFRKRKMTPLQQNCAHAILTQYFESLTIAKLQTKMKKQINAVADAIKAKDDALPHNKPRIIWTCWLQGMDNAPDLVKICFKSMLDNFSKDYEINVITEENYANFVSLPEVVLKKYEKGIISRTHFSDIIRLELLIKYGGIWIDSTLFFSRKLPCYMTDDDFFVFQSIWPQLFGRATRMESWYISSCQNNPLLIFTRDMLYYYWTKYNVLVDYWLIYDLFEIGIDKFEEVWNKVIPVSQCDVHILQDKLFEEFDETIFTETISRVPIHKLNWRATDDMIKKSNTYYKHLINNFEKY